MRSTLLSIVVGCVVLLTGTVVHAQVPDPGYCTIGFDLQDQEIPGLMTCPDGDARPLKYVKVTICNSEGEPLIGVPYTDFEFWPSYDLSFTVQEGVNNTDGTGSINFSVRSNVAIPSGSEENPVWVTVDVMASGVYLGALNLRCNTVDFDLDGDVDPIDFAAFVGWYGLWAPQATAANFSWSGPGTPPDSLNGIDPVDLALFARHFGHGR